MRRTLKKMSAVLVTLTLSVSCAVHEWPETLPADATLKLDFNTALPQFIVLDVNDTRASKDSRDYQIRYVVEAYRKLGNGATGHILSLLTCVLYSLRTTFLT